MDNLDHDEFDVAGAVKVAADIRSSIITKAKRKKAQKISDEGGYNTLSAYQKSLIPVPAYALQQAQTIAAATGQAAASVTDQIKNADPVPISGGQLKKYLPYILGVVVLGVLVYFISKN